VSDTQVRDGMPRLSEEGDPIASFAGRVLDVLVDRSRRSSSTLRDDLVATLAEGMLHQDEQQLEAALRAFRRACISPSAMAETYVPAAARLLGSDWACDRMGFADVTIGTARLQALVRAIGTRWAGDSTLAPGFRTVLMIVPERHDHTLGAIVATGQLRRMGLSVCLRLGPGRRELIDLLRTRIFDAAMISVGHSERIDLVSAVVDTLRAYGPRGMPILAGGPVPLAAEELKRRTGADFVTSDLDLAVSYCGFTASAAPGTKTGTRSVVVHD
jgi:methylmalonyl-CoA mutase cobalamin-binding subunit